MNSDGEWWDVVDVDGVLTGETFRRGASNWPAGRFHLIVAVCVQREDGAVLLTQRAADKKEFPLSWEFPGGSALVGESSRVAANRELLEETALDVPADSLELIGRFVEASALLDFYVASEPAEADLILQASEVAAAEWVPVHEVERRANAGAMAVPWSARLDALWPRAVRSLRDTL
ncbi:NUDIX domain-containing protein [Agromyces sp. NPDC056965]|uniref:NUDIX hydrolase n=1 Tax=Agromyces sp. NPDC056965 TaxID=3345983 RepID=UPI00363151F1